MINTYLKLRLRALFIDYLCIVIYLIILFAVAMGIYLIVFSISPEFTEEMSQWIAFLTTVLPITIYYSYKESGRSFASFGKKKVGLIVKYSKSPIVGSILRNVFKFLPWQLGHMAVIKGIYNGFELDSVMYLNGLAILLPIIYIGMVVVRSDHRHIPDLVARSYVDVI